MRQEKADILIVKLFEHRINTQEAEALYDWLEEGDNLAYFNEFVQTNHLIQAEQSFDHRKSLTAVKHYIYKMRRRRRTTNLLKYAALFIVLLGIGYLLLPSKEDVWVVDEDEPSVVNNNIEPGSAKAVLTLDDGSEVALDTAKTYQNEHIKSKGAHLMYEPNDLEEQEELVYNYLTIPRGGQYTLTLSDGTQVWLNSESKLKYPKRFLKDQKRQVELVYGEAYFEVSPSAKHNGNGFLVKAAKMEAQVLGTEFNIKAYQDEEEVYTTLVEGSVGLKTEKDQTIAEKLKPKQQAVLKEVEDGFEVETLESLNELLWRKGLFSFKNKPLNDILKVLERWYDMEVFFKTSELKEIEFTGVLNKEQSIEEILDILYQTEQIEYAIKDKTVTLK